MPHLNQGATIINENANHGATIQEVLSNLEIEAVEVLTFIVETIEDKDVSKAIVRSSDNNTAPFVASALGDLVNIGLVQILDTKGNESIATVKQDVYDAVINFEFDF
ncbi:MAG: hypothetical protein CL760_08900 [Chloroflexi bacterium]|nr:hypothetical protein [Chloroflexota bacterium]|tara:strand:- start:59978 stop:60298 length:321 start_codon:yes stop_codon:yes gene_type:complete